MFDMYLLDDGDGIIEYRVKDGEYWMGRCFDYSESEEMERYVSNSNAAKVVKMKYNDFDNLCEGNKWIYTVEI